ncbi:uncharacterized protein L201_002077 [Kwoniella dendrophila CBS 6074]|uniref:Uncharacterized protein n=1 Tax=Kwoniella dendrophila CBS 6074 TaxID=1295534 RepID=A0AAX4JP77_9TREE
MSIQLIASRSLKNLMPRALLQMRIIPRQVVHPVGISVRFNSTNTKKSSGNEKNEKKDAARSSNSKGSDGKSGRTAKPLRSSVKTLNLLLQKLKEQNEWVKTNKIPDPSAAELQKWSSNPVFPVEYQPTVANWCSNHATFLKDLPSAGKDAVCHALEIACRDAWKSVFKRGRNRRSSGKTSYHSPRSGKRRSYKKVHDHLKEFSRLVRFARDDKRGVNCQLESLRRANDIFMLTLRISNAIKGAIFFYRNLRTGRFESVLMLTPAHKEGRDLTRLARAELPKVSPKVFHDPKVEAEIRNHMLKIIKTVFPNANVGSTREGIYDASGAATVGGRKGTTTTLHFSDETPVDKKDETENKAEETEIIRAAERMAEGVLENEVDDAIMNSTESSD